MWNWFKNNKSSGNSAEPIPSEARSPDQPEQLDYADRPIDTPDQDLFAIDPFVRSIAAGMMKMHAPEGVVVAINGPWGSGKSSAINLLKHHLQPAVEAGDLQFVSFNPWWFRGEEALALAFFRDLHAATNPSLAAKSKKLLPKLGARLMRGGKAMGAGADFLGAGGAGAVAGKTLDWLSDLIEDKESVEKLHTELATALAGQQRRFIVFIDDIDRLGPDEALAVFRLVKSVGRFPNVIYVLAFDRLLAEKVVKERFPSEGAHYLEKIIQVSFALPLLDRIELQEQLQNRIFEIVGMPDDGTIVEFMNLFHEIVAREVTKPRDIFRLANALSLTWPAVAGNVFAGDFVALEAYRLFQPALYGAIQNHPEHLCGTGSSEDKDPERMDALFLSSVHEKDRYRRGLMRLFPRLESVWDNVHYSSDVTWAKQRRVRVEEHFPTYFRFSLGQSAVSKQETDDLISHAADPSFVRERLMEAVNTPRRSGGTRAALLLDALIQNASDIPIEQSAPLLSTIFGISDELNVEGDKARGFAVGNNRLRIHWLLRALLMDRTKLEERSAILMKAANGADLAWLCDLANSAWDDYHPRKGKKPEPPENCILTLDAATELRKRALHQIRDAAKRGTLIAQRGLATLLYIWRNYAADGGRSVKAWTAKALKDDSSVVQLARAFTSHSWSQGMGMSGLGDLVAKRSDSAAVNSLDEILDKKKFRERVEELDARGRLPKEDADVIHRFLEAWRRKDRGEDD